MAVAVLLLLAFQACGRKGDPQPPPQKHPAKTSDLKVEQRGQELVLTMSYPTMTVGGLALPGIDRLDLHQYTRPAPEFMEQPGSDADESGSAVGPEAPTAESPGEPAVAEETPPTAAPATESPAGEVEVEDLTPAPAEATQEAPAAESPPIQLEPEEPNPFLAIRIDPKEYDKQSEVVLTLEGDALEAAVVGGRVEMRLPLDQIATEPPMAYAFTVETFAGRLRSPESNRAAFVPLPPPPIPGGLSASVEQRGVRLSWDLLDDESEIEGYRILRRPAQVTSFAEPLTTVNPGVAEYFDSGVRFGNRYVYAISTMRMERPLVESALSAEQAVDYRDVFAPRAPLRLVALAEVGRVRLLWDAGNESDLAGYLVFVSAGGGDPEQLTPEPIRGTEFVHEGTVSGATYVYTVRAVDESGNQSEDSSPATTRAP